MHGTDLDGIDNSDGVKLSGFVVILLMMKMVLIRGEWGE